MYLALLGILAAVVLFVRTAGPALWAWWNERIHTYAVWMADELSAMFVTLTVERAKRFISIAVISGVVLGFLFAGIVSAIVFGALGYFGPRGWILWKRMRRLERIDDQLVDTLLLMSNALKSGLSFQQSLELAVREIKAPMNDELERVVKEIHLGRLTDDALRRFAERVPLEDIKLSVDAILTLRETGGDLSETFEIIAKTVVERKKVQGKIKAMTSQGMSQGVLVCLMPVGMLMIFAMISPEYIRPFFNTPIGIMMLLLVFVLDAMGLWMMFKLVKVDV
ncbi:MAG: type II secretion system F family protein [Acidobacteria bacterium]|nr:type II secretion system F family protein [Acidobacteriota bacterium]